MGVMSLPLLVNNNLIVTEISSHSPPYLYPARLLARSTPFQGVGTGSKPVQDTNPLMS